MFEVSAFIQRVRTLMYQASISATTVITTKAAISLAVTCKNVAMVKTGTVTMEGFGGP